MPPVAALSGPQRAALILAQLDDARAQALLAVLPEGDVVRLMAEVARLPSVDAQGVADVVADFTEQALAYGKVRQGGIDVARRWLGDRLGPARASEFIAELEMMVAPEPLDFLHHVDAAQIAGFLANEHPQTVALVLAKLRRELAARVLDHLEQALSTDVVRRIAKMGPVPPAVVQQVSEVLHAQLAAVLQGTGGKAMGGVSATAAVLNNLDRTAEKSILARIEVGDPELADAIRAEMFVFDDVVQLDDATLQVVLRSVVLRDVALALKTAPDDVAERFMRNVSVRAADDLREEMQSLGPQRLSAIEAAQAAIMRVVTDLAESDAIALGRPDDELIA